MRRWTRVSSPAAAGVRELRPRYFTDKAEAEDVVQVRRFAQAAVFLARLGRWDDVPGGQRLGGQSPWAVDRLFFPHCKMETPWADFAFAVDVSAVYERKRQALAAYTSIFQPEGDRLLALYEAEDQYFGRLPGVAYAEIFRSASPVLLADPNVILPALPG